MSEEAKEDKKTSKEEAAPKTVKLKALRTFQFADRLISEGTTLTVSAHTYKEEKAKGAKKDGKTPISGLLRHCVEVK